MTFGVFQRALSEEMSENGAYHPRPLDLLNRSTNGTVFDMIFGYVGSTGLWGLNVVVFEAGMS